MSSNQRLGTRMILEVQFQNCGARVKVLIFKKFQGAQILIFGPPKIFFNEIFDVCVPKIGIFTSKIIPDL